MKVLVVGAGGREHALVWKIIQSPKVEKVYVAPGNGGMKEAERVNIPVHEIVSLADFAEKEKIDLTVVGPEVPLSLGIVDEFKKRGLKIFGPEKIAAELEASKVFAKEFMKRHVIPTAEFDVITDYVEGEKIVKSGKYGFPVVIKTDGLAAGKGSFVCETQQEALNALDLIINKRKFALAGDRVVIEKFLPGKEISFTVITDGTNILPMVTSLDHKRAFDGNKGPNTGGMGAISPCPYVNTEIYRRIIDTIIKPAISGMLYEGRKFTGVLYAGLMLTEVGPMVLEFNVRFGDPESQAILLRLESDLVDILEGAINGFSPGLKPVWDKKPSVVVVLASGGYPGSYEKGKEIKGLDNLPDDVVVFHAGTEYKDGKYFTAGGRVLNVAAKGETLSEAREKVYAAIEKIHFDKMHFRRDIGVGK
ncbi:MAG: phosphoribosylamine--glycine ligase [Candidatus Aminicenantes bacterium]|nr:phosphoribosylamine--glycine ligase [Candidatus Aminicenantes bacterium]